MRLLNLQLFAAIFLNLQLFADAGNFVNTTTGQVNAYNGTATTLTPNMSPSMKTYYDTELLDNARSKLIFAQLGKKQPLPKNHGKTVEWRKFNTFAPALEPLQEAVIPTGKQFGMTNLTVAIVQHGDYTAISDQLEMHAVDPVILGATEEMGAAGGETADILVRNVLVGGTNVQYAPDISTTPPTAVTGRGGIKATSILTPDEVNKAVTMLKKQKAPTFEGGKYVAVIHPSVAYDLRSSEEWIEVHKYAATTQIFNGEIGELHGCRFIETTNAPIFKGADLASNSRTLAVNLQAGYAIGDTSIAFDSGTVAVNALKGRRINIGGYVYEVVSNTVSAITIASPGLKAAVADNAVIYPGEGGNGGIASYATLFFGKDAFGVVDPAGMGMEMIIHSRAEAGGPLDQFSTVGYKFEEATAILYQERMVRVETGSAYSSVDEAN